MVRFYIRFSLILIVLFAVCVIMFIAVGSIQPINPALRGFVEGCEGVTTLCWHGIVSGETSLDIAQEILTRGLTPI